MRINNSKYNLLGLLALALMIIVVHSCQKRGEDLTLNALPDVDFEIAQGPDANTVILVNKTNAPSIPFWTVVNTGAKLNGDSARLKLIFAGTYDIKLIVAAQGGLDSIVKTVTIANSDPNACNGTAIGFIASCTEKTWKLNPEAGTYMVGPGPNNGSWWSSGAGDVSTRSCEFQDEYTFHFNASGTFEYDNKGDFYADGYLGAGTHGCEPNANLSNAHKPWGSGTFTFTVIDGAGVNGLGQLRVNGAGAHIGLQKVHNGGETTSGPVGNAITYDILETRTNVGGNGYDILKLGVNIGGDAWWTFTLRSY